MSLKYLVSASAIARGWGDKRSYGRWHHRSGRERSGWTGTSWGTTAAARRRRCDGDNGHLKRLVHLSHEERKQQQQQSTHSHTPDLAFTLTFTVLVLFTTFVVSIALVDCCVVRSRHANTTAVRRGKSSPSPPPPPRRRHRCRPPPPAASISSPPSSDGVGQSAATWGPPIPVQGQPIHNQAVRAPPRCRLRLLQILLLLAGGRRAAPEAI